MSDACAAQPYPDMGWGALTAEEVQRVTLTVMAHEFGEVTHTRDLIGRLRLSQDHSAGSHTLASKTKVSSKA